MTLYAHRHPECPTCRCTQPLPAVISDALDAQYRETKYLRKNLANDDASSADEDLRKLVELCEGKVTLTIELAEHLASFIAEQAQL